MWPGTGDHPIDASGLDRRLVVAVLESDPLPVWTGIAHEFIVGSRVRDLPLIEHDDAIRLAYRRKTMGDEEDRPLPAQGLDCILNGLFRFGIECAGGFIEDQDGRMENRDAPSLS